MLNAWRAGVIATALVGVTAMTTSITTAYLLRPTPTAEAQVPLSTPPAQVATRSNQVALPPSPPLYRATAPEAPAVTRVAGIPAVVARPARPVAGVPADCASTGDRVLRIAKPGGLGGLIGAGLGAVTGAIANGGKAAGKGAMIGGLVGVAAGSAYGAYKTKNECGTILGGHA